MPTSLFFRRDVQNLPPAIVLFFRRDVQNLPPNNTDYNKTELSNTYLIKLTLIILKKSLLNLEVAKAKKFFFFF